MFCSHCGVTVQPGQQFCSKCGQPLATPATPPAAAAAVPVPPASLGPSGIDASGGTPRRLERHVRVLGILWVVYSALRLLPGGALLFFGHLRLPFLLTPLPLGSHAFMGRFLLPLGLFILSFAVIGIVAGFGLMAYNGGARVAIIILACLNLIHIPFGTALGIYTFWVLFAPGADREFARLRRSRI
jgi:hypothetical protein